MVFRRVALKKHRKSPPTDAKRLILSTEKVRELGRELSDEHLEQVAGGVCTKSYQAPPDI